MNVRVGGCAERRNRHRQATWMILEMKHDAPRAIRDKEAAPRRAGALVGIFQGQTLFLAKRIIQFHQPVELAIHPIRHRAG